MQPDHSKSLARVLKTKDTLQHNPDGSINKYWSSQRGIVTAGKLPIIMNYLGEERRMRLWYEEVDPGVNYYKPESSFIQFLKNRGIHFEAVAREAFELLTGKKVTQVGSVSHEKFPWFTASPDGVIEEEAALIEIKWSWHPFDPNSIKTEHYVQIQAQLEVCQLEVAYLIRYCQDGYLHWTKIYRNEPYFNNCWAWMLSWKNKILSQKMQQ